MPNAFKKKHYTTYSIVWKRHILSPRTSKLPLCDPISNVSFAVKTVDVDLVEKLYLIDLERSAWISIRHSYGRPIYTSTLTR